MAKTYRKHEILKYLPPEDRDMFLSELIEAITQAKKKNDFSIIDHCLNSWEATAELNSIPGFSEKVWAKFNRLKSSGKINE